MRQYQQQYNNNYSNMNIKVNYSSVRSTIKFFTWFGLILSALVGFLYLFEFVNMNMISKPAATDNSVIGILKALRVTNLNDLFSAKILMFTLIPLTIVKSIIFNSALIRFINKSSDYELEANKWMLAVLSLSVGGLYTPFLLTKLSNNASTSTIKFKKPLGRIYGITGIIGCSAAIIITAIAAITTSHSENLTAVSQNVLILTSLSIAVIIAFCISAFVIFSSKNIEQDMENKNFIGRIANIIGTIILIVVTIELLLRIVISILNAIESVSRALKTGGFFGFLRLMFSLLYIALTIYLIKIIWDVITSLWKANRNNNFVKHSNVQKISSTTKAIS